MATATQLGVRLLAKLLPVYYDMYTTGMEASGQTPLSYEEWEPEGVKFLEPITTAEAEAIWDFLSIDCRVDSGIDIEVDTGITVAVNSGMVVASGIACAVLPTTHVGQTTATGTVGAGTGATNGKGAGRTTEQGRIV